MRLIVTPDRAHAPAPGKHAGLGITLYGLRSQPQLGHAAISAICAISIDWAVPQLHVDFIALNPLHAIHNRRPYNTSPYLPNSIFYRNFIYLDVEDVAGYDRIRAALRERRNLRRDGAAARIADRGIRAGGRAETPGARTDLRSLRPDPTAKSGSRAKAICCASTPLTARLTNICTPKIPTSGSGPTGPPSIATRERRRARNSPPNMSARFSSTAGCSGMSTASWPRVQQHARRAGMRIGLYHDLALATDRCGSDLWAHRQFFIAGCSVGSPPDDFSPVRAGLVVPAS